MSKTTALASVNAGPFVEVSTKLYIHLPPCFTTKPIEGIQEQLNSFLMRFVTGDCFVVGVDAVL
jgi:DNA-directed RNA polymerase I subunit RPA43